MDQAIEILAKKGSAKLIEFGPLRSTDVTLPPGAKFVIANRFGQQLNLLAFSRCLRRNTLRFHKIILNGRGHVFCVCFDFSRPFFSLLLFHNPIVHNPDLFFQP